MRSPSFPSIHCAAEARELLELPLAELFRYAGDAREACSGMELDLCSILNVKSGACSEDCGFCAQSARFRTQADVYPLVSIDKVRESCLSSRDFGAGRFCVVSSGRSIRDTEADRLAEMVGEVRQLGLLPCATLGMASVDQLQRLKEAGLHRYHHNLESSERFFGRICSTHTYRERLATVRNTIEAGLSSCSGGIFGLGESWADRIDLALTLRELGVDSIPVNFLVPVEGTPMARRPVLTREEALRILALFRLVLPDKEIRVCGGRNTVFREDHEALFTAGANGFLIGNYLTTLGRDPADDRRMMEKCGYRVRAHAP